MDGLNFQPAGRFQRSCKKPSRPCEFLARPGFVFSFQIIEGGAQIFIIFKRPFAKQFEQTLGHFCGSGFGEGDAEDFGRIGIVEKQPRYAVSEYARFPRPCIGGDKGGTAQASRRGADRRLFFQTPYSCVLLSGPFAPAREMVIVAKVIGKFRARL